MADAAASVSIAYDSPAHRVLIGWGVRGQLAAELGRMGFRRPLLVCSARAAESIEVKELAASIALPSGAIFARELMHAPLAAAHEGAALARRLDADVLISFGGGSPGDLAKGIALAVAEGDAMLNFELKRAPDGRIISATSRAKKLPIVAVPTTLSAAEVTPGFSLTDEQGVKILFRDASLCPRLLVYDSQLMTGVPLPAMTASAMNSLAHSVEALYSKGCNPISDMFAEKSLPLVHGAMRAILGGARDEAVYNDLALGAYCAGVAIVNARTGLHHAMCHKLGPATGLSHGTVNTIMLPHVLAFNCDSARNALVRAAQLLGSGDGPAAVISTLRELPEKAGLPLRLRDYGVDPQIFPALAQRILGEPGLAFNPRPVASAAELAGVLQNAW